MLAAVLTGCGSLDAPGFSGGGVPIGGSRLFGRVVAANIPHTDLPNVTVRVLATPDGGQARDLVAVTGRDGTFNFTNVLQGANTGTVRLTASPVDTAYQAQQITLNVAAGHTEQMIVTLPPSSFDPLSASSIDLALASPAVPTGSSVQLQALVRDAAGKPLSVTPTLVFDGNFGTLNPDGTFTVPAGILSGNGTITAYWFNLPPQLQPVHVDKNGSQQPPSPPVLPQSHDTTMHP